MATPSFSPVFGGSNIAPANASYLALSITADVTLEWPVEQAISDLVVANIIDVTALAAGLNVNLPDATEVGSGFTSLINNVGGNTVSIRDATGSTIISLASGTVWEIYLIDNSTVGGTWRTFQFGASVSVAVASALAGSGLKAIGTTLNERMAVSTRATTYVIVDADRANVQLWTGGVGSFTLPDPAVVGSDWFVEIKNGGSGNLTVTPGGAAKIDGAATLILSPLGSLWVVTDGTNFYSLGQGGGSSSGGAFNLVSIDVSGAGNFVLAGANLNQIGYRFTGTLTGNRTIVVPGTAQEYWVDNETTGAFTLSVATSGQTTPAPPVIPQSNRAILYCDATNVVSAESSTVSFPIPVAQGGTGATTASAARTNLGATATGTSLFTAASSATALAAIGGVPTSETITAGTGLTGGGDLSAARTIAVDVTGTGTVGFRDIPQNAQSANYQLALTDRGEHIYCQAPINVTVPTNATVAFPVGSTITVVAIAGPIIIVQTSGVGLLWAGQNVTGNRTLAVSGIATLLKTDTNTWFISGAGLS